MEEKTGVTEGKKGRERHKEERWLTNDSASRGKNLRLPHIRKGLSLFATHPLFTAKLLAETQMNPVFVLLGEFTLQMPACLPPALTDEAKIWFIVWGTQQLAEEKYERRHTVDLHLPVMRLLSMALSFFRAKIKIDFSSLTPFIQQLLPCLCLDCIQRPNVFD